MESSESSSVKLPEIPGAQPKSSSTSALPKDSARIAFTDQTKIIYRTIPCKPDPKHAPL